MVHGNVYGGGNKADVKGNATVTMTAGTVAKNVFGGGKGMADSFQCEKAMVGVNGDGGTTVTITGGTVKGSVYGGGEVGRVEKNTVVNIGAGDGTATATASPVIKGSVFGAGKGVSTHGYAALVRGNATVNVTGNAAVMQSVYGGGEIASVGRYTVAQTAAEAAEHDVEIGEPYSLANDTSGNCRVTVGGYAEIGPDDMRMKKAEGDPDDTGYVFGAGKGVLPYEGYAAEETPWRQTPGDDMTSNDDDDTENYGAVNEENYIKYIGTLALTTQTFVTIKDHAFIKGSVYGGSENGHVQHDTDVKIQDHCQIGNGWNGTSGVNKRYDEAYFINPTTATATEIETAAGQLYECASWDYGVKENGKMVYHPYDKYEARDGASTTGTDGHTFFGNVFGGGSGLYPYLSRKDGVYEWIRTAGHVGGNTSVTITGGHILTSVYGGCELTDVGNSVTLKEGKGKCTIKMSGGTLGVPRTLEQITAHPVTCYLFGAGKGDQRVHFNQWTNVGSVEVEISGGIIYGSVFGGGEDGHVLGDVRLTIKDETTTTGEGVDAVTTTTSPVIGTWGTSYVDGNIFGGGRGFGGDALTAGVVSGNVTIDIQGGTMLGSIYGGGRLGSVGTFLVPATITDPNDPTATIKNPRYGQMISDGWEQVIGGDSIEATGVTHGHITINISGGTIGNNLEYLYNPDATAKAKIPNTTFDHQNHVLYTKGGNVFTGGMGRLYELDGTTLLPHWSNMAKARNTELNISGGTIKSNVYGGAELGTVEGNTTVNIKGGTIGTKVVNPKDATQYYYYGSVFGGGKGSTEAIADKYPAGTDEALKTDISKAGQVGGDVAVNLNNGVSNTAKGGIVHKIFGCNDTNGSPLGAVTVHVYKTQNEAATTIVNPAEGEQVAKVRGRYDVEAVYGGGNLASYQPTDGTKVAKVIIDGCDETSIETVYGGGNAASTPGTHVEVNASYEIGTIFGGGNGRDLLPSGGENPGAHVGYKADGTTSYGTGRADVQLKGGTIHSAFGGSNTKGNVRVKATVDLSEPEDGAACPLVIEEVYGAGNEAEQDGTAEIILGCLSYLKEIYGGAKNADIDSDVTLTIRSGRFDRVFGGNNLGGKISGTITVNIEETGCHPIIIGQLYGGGNRAAYSVDDIAKGRSDLNYEDASAEDYYRNFPKVNVRSFTSIGEIYGGGYGAEAEVTGNPFVDINVCEGDNRSNEVENRTIDGATVSVSKNTGKTITLNAGQADEMQLEIPLHKSGAIGAIGSVYGGGNAANVIGDTHVSIGTKMTENIIFETPKTKKVTEGGVTTVVSTEDEDRTHEVKGADIRGNVFGGGNRANVTGNTDVKVGR